MLLAGIVGTFVGDMNVRPFICFHEARLTMQLVTGTYRHLLRLLLSRYRPHREWLANSGALLATIDN
jgi:hypothetical protein